MHRDHFTLIGIEHIEACIRHHAEELAYLTVWDRTDRTTDETVGRFEFDDTSAMPYLEEPEEKPSLFGGQGTGSAAAAWGPENDEDEEDEPEEDEPEARAGLADAARDGESFLSAVQIANAACRWLRALAMRCTMGEEYRRFRVRMYAVKASRVVESGSFLCRNDDYELQVAPTRPRAEIPKPTFDEAAQEGGAKAMRSLGDLYAQWGHIVIGSVDQLQGVNNSMNAQLHRQLRDARDQVDQLVAAILTFRHQQAMSEDQRGRSEREDDTKAALARDAINQLGEAARVFLSSRGLSPEMAEVLAHLGNSPELSAALADPDVRALMQDPKNLESLALLLRHSAAQARAMREAMQAQGSQAQAQGAAPPDPDNADPHQPTAG